MNELALFAGAGGGIYGGLLLGWRTVAAVESSEYARAVLLRRQLDGILPRFPCWDDIRTFDPMPWRGNIDIITGGFPCQDVSVAGKGAGITGKKSGLWFEMARCINSIRPQFVFVENSPMLISRGLDRILSDLAAIGYDAVWDVIGARHLGAHHPRDRIWILAYTGGTGKAWGKPKNRKIREKEKNVPDPASPGLERENARKKRFGEKENGLSPELCSPAFWDRDPAEEDTTAKSFVGRVAYGVACRRNRLKALGEGQVPVVAATAFTLLQERLIKLKEKDNET